MKPHQAKPPAPHTLDGWLRTYRQDRLLAFIPAPYVKPNGEPDLRHAGISLDAAKWVNENWRNFSGPGHLFKAISRESKTVGWTIPSESWFYRRWTALPEIIRVMLLEGKKA